MQTLASPRRPGCARCWRPQPTCICRWVTPVAHVVEVLILQHALEVRQAKGTARLLHLSLPNSQMASGEIFDSQLLQGTPRAALESAPSIDPVVQIAPIAPRDASRPKYNILLYPDTPHLQSLGMAGAHVLAPDALRDPSQLRLVVLDGTWRKSRKLLYLNPLLQHMPRLSLQNLPASSYRIRKAQRPGQLSTLEATCAALAQLEGSAEKFLPLLQAFEGFMMQQLDYGAR